MLERILRNWPLKLLALGLALFVWLAVTGENRIVKDFQVPLEIAVRQDCTLADLPPTAVEVRLRGPESLVQRIAPYGLAVRVDLRDASPGERSILLGPSAVMGVPRGVEVVYVEPDRLTLELDRKMRVFLPVVPSLAGSPPQGYAFYGARVDPDRVEVEGPRSQVESLSRLRTDPVSLDGRTAPFVERVSAIPDNPRVNVVDPRRVSVRADVDLAPVDRTFPDVPVVLAGSNDEAVPRPGRVSVTVSGPPALVGSLRPTQVRAVADSGGVAADGSADTVPLRVELVDVPLDEIGRLTIKSVSHETISIRIGDRRTRS